MRPQMTDLSNQLSDVWPSSLKDLQHTLSWLSLKLCKNLSTSRSSGTSGSKSVTPGSNSDLGLLGLRASSVRIFLVASLPRATREDSNTCRADDNSPTWVKWKAFAVLHSTSFLLRRLFLAVVVIPFIACSSGLSTSVTHSPLLNCAKRSSNLRRGTRPPHPRQQKKQFPSSGRHLFVSRRLAPSDPLQTNFQSRTERSSHEHRNCFHD